MLKLKHSILIIEQNDNLKKDYVGLKQIDPS